MIKDLHLILRNIASSIPERNHFFYWEDADRDSLSRLVSRFYSEDTPERRAIREIVVKRGVRSFLDVGCGVGAEAIGLRAKGIDIAYTGVDKSNYMLDVAREKNPHTQFFEGDCEDLGFLDSSFDCVLIKHVLEHLQHYRKSVTEAVRVARNFVIVDFFHRLLPIVPDLLLYNHRGYFENWYNRSKFHSFLGELPISRYRKIAIQGTLGQTAEIYVLKNN